MTVQIKQIWWLAMLMMTSCQSSGGLPRISVGPTSIEPLWSMYAGCSGGIDIGPSSVTLARRVGPDHYEKWVIDSDSGRVVGTTEDPGRMRMPPKDTTADLTQGTLGPLDRSNAARLTPEGFTPVILTNRFLFAKRTRTHFASFRFYTEAQVALIDRPTGNTVWTDEGFDMAILASTDRVFVCDDGTTSAFAFDAGRPSEISEFYAAIRVANLDVIRSLYPKWRQNGMYAVDGMVPLSVAAKEDKLEAAKLLVELGESPNVFNADGSATLITALFWGHHDVADYLIDAGATATRDADFWESALRLAVQSGGRPIIERILRSGVKIDFVETWSGRTALHEAVMYRNYEAIETLIAAGANVNATDKDGNTPSNLTTDECVAHLFKGGTVKEKPTICKPIERKTVTLDGNWRR